MVRTVEKKGEAKGK